MTASRRGAPMGTPAYTSPEQAQGRLEEVDELTDLWLLGATLFHVLTGRPPYSEQTLARGLDVAVTPRDPERRRKALSTFAATLRRLAG